MRRALGLGLAVLVAGVAPAAATAGAPQEREFATGISASTAPWAITAGPDGNVWFAETQGGGVGRITPSGVVTEFPITAAPAGPQPNGIAAGPDGNLWLTEYASNQIARVTPAGAVAVFSTGLSAHSGADGIAAGPDGNLWFTESTVNKIGQITPAGTITEFPASGGPGGIAAGPDGNLWFTEIVDRIGRITPLGAVTEFSAGITAGANPSSITAGPDGNLWFTEDGIDRVGRITPSGVVTEFSAGITAGSRPDSITAGADGNLWFAESGGTRVGRITPSGVVTEFPTGPTHGHAPFAITTGPDGNLWFAEAMGPRIGRMTTGIDPPRYTDPTRIEVPASGTTQGPASPYPAAIDAEDLQGTVTKVTARLNDVDHASAADIEAELVAPDGTSVLLMADSTVRIGDPSIARQVLAGQTVTFADGGPAAPRFLTSGIFAPITPGFALNFTAPAPTTPATTLTAFDGHNPNGVWKLYVDDNQGAPDSTGVIAGGWSLDIQTSGPPPVGVSGPTTAITVPPPTPPPPPDTTKPTLLIARIATKSTQKAFRAGLTFRVTPSEPVTLDLTLAAPVRRATIAAAGAPLVLARQTVTLNTTAAKTLTLKPSAKLLGHPRHTFKAVLRIVATDRAGNRTTTTRTITVAPDPTTHHRRSARAYDHRP